MSSDDLLETEANSPFKTRSALLVSVLALVLAVASLGGSNATKDATMENILASDAYNFYQAKNQRQTAFKLASDQIQVQLARGDMPAAAKDMLEKQLAKYKETIARYESEPETGEGKKELLVRAKGHERNRDLAMQKDPWFDYAQALLQIAIVLTSLSIITNRKFFFYLSTGLGLAGIACTLQGYFLF